MSSIFIAAPSPVAIPLADGHGELIQVNDMLQVLGAIIRKAKALRIEIQGKKEVGGECEQPKG